MYSVKRIPFNMFRIIRIQRCFSSFSDTNEIIKNEKKKTFNMKKTGRKGMKTK
jgi:hypothetical protein